MLLHTRTRMRSEPPGQELSGELYLYVRRNLPARFLTDGMPASKLRPHFPWAPFSDINVAWGYLELSTAIEEALHRERCAVPPNPQPREPRTFSVRLQAVRDLRLPAEQQHFGLTVADLLNTAPSGRAHWASELAWKEGAEGLWVPSAIFNGGSVLVIFPGSLRPGSYFRPTTRL
jgi:RES domain-containing protein